MRQVVEEAQGRQKARQDCAERGKRRGYGKGCWMKDSESTQKRVADLKFKAGNPKELAINRFKMEMSGLRERQNAC